MALIDALGLAEDFEKAGAPSQQARQMAAAPRDRLNGVVATKADLETAVAELKSELHRELGAMRGEVGGMVWKMAGLLLAQAGLVAALVKLLER